MKFIIISWMLFISSCVLDERNQENKSPEATFEEFFATNYLECTTFESKKECTDMNSERLTHATDELYIYMPVTSTTICQFEEGTNSLIYCECGQNTESISLDINENTGLILMASFQNCELGEISFSKVEQ